MSFLRQSSKHFAPLETETSWTVQTTKGSVRGGSLNSGGAFLGVPFAQPPVGELRWAAPRECLPWKDILECTRFGPSCPQRQIPRPPKGSIEQSINGLPLGLDEDCLQLNVYTPSLEGKRPTLVWIHGGNLTAGASSGGNEFDPSARRGENPAFIFQEHNLVVVSVAYRHNVFGFLNLKGGDGNCGLLDVAMALCWIRDEINKFGGDSDNVTLAGNSAGAHITSQMSCMPAAKGLFHKVICRSGSAQWTLATQEDHDRRIAEPFAKKLGFESLADMTIEKARSLPAELLWRTYLECGSFLEGGTLHIDGRTVPRDALDMMQEGFMKDVKVLSGVTRDEGCFSAAVPRRGATVDDVIDNVKNHFAKACYLMDGDIDCLRHTDPDARRAIASQVVRSYEDLIKRYHEAPAEAQARSVNLSIGKLPALADANYELAVKILGDHDFFLSHLMATWALSHHDDVYSYVFSEESRPDDNESKPEKSFADHGNDNPFFFGTVSGKASKSGAGQLSSSITSSCAAFARTGNPSTSETGPWPPTSFSATAKVLPETPTSWEHMHFEHNRIGIVSYGLEEATIWFTAACELSKLLGPYSALRRATEVMATHLNIEVPPRRRDAALGCRVS